MGMNNKTQFRPVVGTDAVILRQDPAAGYVWFATDTKKIYYSDGNSFLSMGGNAGIYYGNMIPGDDVETGQLEFDFSILDIDGNESVEGGRYKIPAEDDLILNQDGCFYRVDKIIQDISAPGGIIIKTLKLTIAGGNTGPISGNNLVITDAENTKFIRYFTTDTKKAELKMIVKPTVQIENNGIQKIEYTVGALSGKIIDDEPKEFGEVSLDITEYIPKMSTNSFTTVSGSIWDYVGTQRKFSFTVYAVYLSLTTSTTKEILPYKVPSFTYYCTPSGGTSLLNRQVIIRFYDEFNNKVDNDIITPVTENSQMPITVTFPDIGVYTMKVSYQGTLNDGRLVESNTLSHSVVYYDDNPQLIVNVPSTKVEQYSTLNIKYMVAADTASVDKVSVSLMKNSDGKTEAVDYNIANDWYIYFDTVGFYELRIEAQQFGIVRTFDIEVTTYSGVIPTISTNGLTLNLSAVNRSNNEIDRNSWESGPYKCAFNNFSWGKVNGWMLDENGEGFLRVSSGASLIINNFRPFKNNTMESGQTIELDFRISGVTDFSKPLIQCVSMAQDEQGKDLIQTGFSISGQQSTFNTNSIKVTGKTIADDGENPYNTQIQGLTANFVEGERIHLTWVIENDSDAADKFPMIHTYINGMRCGITQYEKGGADSTQENPNRPAYFTIDSTYGIVDIYNIRFYNESALQSSSVLKNFIATAGTIDNKVALYEDNSPMLTANATVQVEEIENAINNGYKLRLPYIKITGGRKLQKNDNGSYTDNHKSNDTEILPQGKKDYRLISKYEYIDPNNSANNRVFESSWKNDGSVNGLVMYGQGTSSMEYPVKNLRFKSKMKDEDGNKVLFKVNDCSVDLICLKADFMESSGSHNTGTGNLVYTLLKSMQLKTPGQEHWTKDKVGYETVTAIRGYPVLIFFKPEGADDSEAYEFIGKYNYNLDKATHEPFGFMHDEEDEFGWEPNDYISVKITNDKAFNEYPFKLYKQNNNEYIEAKTYETGVQYYSIHNKIHCYEFLNNTGSLDHFLKDSSSETFEQCFTKMVLDEDGNLVPYWYTCFESRYPEFADYESTDIASWQALCTWVNSTCKNDATNNQLEEVYVGIDNTEYTHDTKEYRLAKFRKEFTQHFDLNFTCFYYILTHVLLMIDSRSKNLMMATWDNEKWYPIFYDMDTMLGLNNYGYNKYNYDIEDSNAGVYNGQDSVLWNNFKETFSTEIQDMYQRMQTAGLQYLNLVNNYNDRQADAANESIYNHDSQYKYIRPFAEEYWDDITNGGTWVKPGTKDYLYASQGSRSMHRKWWLQNRMQYFNGKYLSQNYKSNKYTLRIYRPQLGEIQYIPQYDLTAEEYNFNIENNNTVYYYYDEEKEQYIVSNEFKTGTLYYIEFSNNAALEKSLAAVPANNDFDLIPLTNQYLSVAYGGDNGDLVKTGRILANTKVRIDAPSDSYNDTETYIYGGSMLKDLGDLSPQYLGQFHFPSGTTKLETLTLGNKHPDYYNPNFSSLMIGSAAPSLKTLDLSNCIGLRGRTLSTVNCQNLEKVYATGSGMSNIVFPTDGVLREVRLPETIVALQLINHKHLTKNNFTIGTYDYTTKTYKDAESNRLIRLYIDNTDIDSYSLVKKSNLQQFYLNGINWRIDNPNDIDKSTGKIFALDKLLKINTYNDKTIAQSLIGTITLDCSSENLNLTTDQALKIYETYAHKPNDVTKVNKYFPNVNFVFEGLSTHLYDVQILDGNDNIWWTKKIKENGIIDETFLSSGPQGKFTMPTMNATVAHTYNFNGEWSVNGSTEAFKGSEEEETLYWPIFTDTRITSNTVLKPLFEKVDRIYEITFVGATGEVIKSNSYKYGTQLATAIPTVIPYKDSSKLPLKETYAFVGYNTDKDASNGMSITADNIIASDRTYYAIFKQVSVYDEKNINEDYFVYENATYTDPQSNETINGYMIKGSSTTELTGKITLPTQHSDGTPIIAIGKFTNNPGITHIFIDNRQESKIKEIVNDAFAGANTLPTKLVHFEFPQSLRRIGARAFHLSPLQPDSANTYDFSSINLYEIGEWAFNQSFSFKQGTIANIRLPGSLAVIKSFAFSNFVQDDAKISIGSQEDWSLLDFSQSLAINSPDETNQNWCPFKFNSGHNIQIEFYSSLYASKDVEIESEYNSSIFKTTVGNWLGEGSGVKVIMHNKNGGTEEND